MLNLMYITNNTDIAQIAQDAGIDRIFIDLEIKGKEERQHNMDTVISKHNISDVKRIKNVLSSTKLLVRVNSIYEESKEEIDSVINQGADIVMLPFFKTVEEVKQFISIVNKRTRTCLLLETPESVERLDDILKISGIDEIHIGLNDLHIGYKMNFMFELLADGTVEKICKKIKNANIPYGFGGIARVGEGTLPSETIIAEHYRLGSTMAILSRSFCNTSKITDLKQIREIFNTGVKDIREFEKSLLNKETSFFENNKGLVKEKVNEIVKEMKKKLGEL